jgi:short-subunit dehydrogenase
VFNSGGYGQIGAVEDLPTPALLEQFEANFFGWIELTELLLPSMLKNNSGRIVMHGSCLGNLPLNWRGAYNASKFTLRATTQSYRKKYKSNGISFSYIETGPVRADFRKNALPYFLKNIDQENSRHKMAYEFVQKSLEEPGPINPFTEQPISVAMRLEHAIENNTTKPRYQVTMPSYMFEGYKKSLTLDDCLSMSWLDNLD